MKREIPAVAARMVWACDLCQRDGLESNDIEVTCVVKDRDYTGGVVYSHELHLCRPCTRRFGSWLDEERERIATELTKAIGET